MPEPGPPKVRRHRLLILQSTSLFDGYGGIEYYLDDFVSLAADLYGLKNVWTVVPQRTGGPARVQRDYPHTRVRFSALPLVNKLENRYSPRFATTAYKVGKRLGPTLIVCGHVSLAPMAYGLSKALRVPYITLAYGIDVWGGLLPQDEWALRRSRGLVSISEWTKKVLVDRGFNPKGIQIVHPRLPDEYTQCPVPTFDRSDRPFTLLTVSRLDAGEQYKGHDAVLQAMHRIKMSYNDRDLNLRYVIQGDGSDRERLEDLAEELELTDTVEFRGAVEDRADFARAYEEADLFVMPSSFEKKGNKWRGEGFGIVYVEAAAFGVPTLAYDCGGVTDIVEHGENGYLVEPGDIGALARSITNLARNHQEVSRLGMKAYERVMARFTAIPIREELRRALNRF